MTGDGAITLAALGAALTGAGWIGVKIWDRLDAYLLHRARRKEAITQFYVAILVRLHNLRSAFADDAREALIARIGTSRKTFKAYVVAAGDGTDRAEIVPFLPTLSEGEIVLIKSYLDYVALFEAYYEKTGSDEFSSLSRDRKIAVICNLFEMADDVRRICERLIPALEHAHPALSRIRETHDSFLGKLEDRAITPVGAADR